MSNRDKKGQYMPGVCGNPKGRPRIDPETQAFRQASLKQFFQILEHYGEKSIKVVRDRYNDPSTPILIAVHLRLMLDSYDGNREARNTLYERLLGKVPDEVITETVNHLRDELRKMNTEELLSLVASAGKSA